MAQIAKSKNWPRAIFLPDLMPKTFVKAVSYFDRPPWDCKIVLLKFSNVAEFFQVRKCVCGSLENFNGMAHNLCQLGSRLGQTRAVIFYGVYSFTGVE